MQVQQYQGGSRRVSVLILLLKKGQCFNAVGDDIDMNAHVNRAQSFLSCKRPTVAVWLFDEDVSSVLG
jgi:hypothetical protein